MTVIPVSKTLSKEGGFSLVELAIVMIILSLIAYPLLQQYKDYLVQQKIDNTTIAFNDLTAAMGDFYYANGRYPCPSDRTKAFGDPEAGKENCTTGVLNLAPGTCKSGGGVCRATGNAPTPPDVQGYVLTGGIPYQDLGIPFLKVLDGYKKPITYSVSQDYADPAKAKTLARNGAIQYDMVRPDKTAPGTYATTTTKDVFYLLVSHGADGAGSFDLYGKQTNCNTNTADSENCDGDAVFRDQFISESSSSPTKYFDDRLMAVATTASTIWAYSEDTPGGIYNTNPGAIGIGTAAPDATVKLDVAGDIKGQQLRSPLYCDANGKNCFDPKSIGGTVGAGGGMECDVAGEVIIGIQENRALCAPRSINVKDDTCKANEMMTGVKSDGTIICKPIPTPTP